MEIEETVMIVLGVVSLLILVLYRLFVASSGVTADLQCHRCGGGNHAADVNCRYCQIPVNTPVVPRQGLSPGRTGRL